MSKPAQEPWKVCAPFEGRKGFEIADKNWNRVCLEVTEDDARRIVACVNALANVDTELLEEVGAHFGDTYNEEFAHGLAVAKQRDELLAALESLLDDMRLRAQLRGDVEDDGCVVLDCGSGVLMKVDAAIAKAKGGPA